MLMAEPDKLPVALHIDKILFIGRTTKKLNTSLNEYYAQR
jgi:hypothetical protein